jgi:hypothetical protein
MTDQVRISAGRAIGNLKNRKRRKKMEKTPIQTTTTGKEIAIGKEVKSMRKIRFALALALLISPLGVATAGGDPGMDPTLYGGAAGMDPTLYGGAMAIDPTKK